MQIFRCDLTLLENTFFSSREISNFYQTEPFIGNYALCYALGLVQAPYFNDGTIYYAQHLTELNDKGIYVMPATIVDRPRFVVQQFNAMPDSYWYAMGNNALVTKPDGWDAVQNGSAWYLVNRETGQRRKVATSNRPQIGRVKMLGIGTKARFYILAAADEPRICRYIRLGKWMSKAKIEAKRVNFTEVDGQQEHISFLLNPLDLSSDATIHTYDLLNVYPVPLLRNALLSSRFFKLEGEGGALLPADMRFGVETLTSEN